MQRPAIKNSIAVGSIVNWLTLVGTVVGLTLYVGRLEAKVDAVAYRASLLEVRSDRMDNKIEELSNKLLQRTDQILDRVNTVDKRLEVLTARVK